jgi:hypothetical protein
LASTYPRARSRARASGSPYPSLNGWLTNSSRIASAAVASQVIHPDGIECYEYEVPDLRYGIGRASVAGRGWEEVRRYENANVKPSAHRAWRGAACCAFHSARHHFFAAIQSGCSCNCFAFRGLAHGRGIDGLLAPRFHHPWFASLAAPRRSVPNEHPRALAKGRLCIPSS